jgi:hypothetical protein
MLRTWSEGFKDASTFGAKFEDGTTHKVKDLAEVFGGLFCHWVSRNLFGSSESFFSSNPIPTLDLYSSFRVRSFDDENTQQSYRRVSSQDGNETLWSAVLIVTIPANNTLLR